MFKIIRNGEYVKQVIIHHTKGSGWKRETEVVDLEFATYKKAEEVAKILKGEVVDIEAQQEPMKMAA